MDSFKKNPIFSAVVLLGALVFIAGAVLAFLANTSVGKSKKKFERAEDALNAAYRGEVAPSTANVEASAQNLRQLTDELKSIRADLERGANLNPSNDGLVVMASIQQFISESAALLDSHEVLKPGSDEMEAAPIFIKDGFAFGFDVYADAATIPDDVNVIPLLDKQRLILEAIVDKLVASNPQSIEIIEREALEAPNAAKKNKLAGTFKIDSAISARVPDAINTLAFRIGFKGYTPSLRTFLNQLAEFDIPLVVRSVEVERPEGSDTIDAEQAEPNDSIDSIFGAFGSDDDADEEVTEEAQKPVIVDNLSTFILVLEFIEVVLPNETNTTEGDAV